MNCTPFTFLHPNISMHILLNVLYKFPKVLTRRICFNNQVLLYLVMLWFNLILGSNFTLLCFKLIIMHYNAQKQKKVKFEPRIKLIKLKLLPFFLQS